MAIGIQTSGIDLDLVFAVRSTAKRADVGWKAAGVDISNRYETIGANPPRVTGLKAAGADLGSLFKGLGGAMSVGGTSSVNGSCFRSTLTSCTATTGAASVTVTGGVGPFTYAWEHVSGTTATVGTAAASSTTFSRNAAVGGADLSGVYRCKVTDTGAGGAIAYGPNCTVLTQHIFTG